MPTRRDAVQMAVRDYVEDCRRIASSGQGTDECSFYTALNNLLTQVGQTADPRRTTIPQPAARGGAFPDVGIYEEASQVLVLPVEAKPTTVTIDDLASRVQPAVYARNFGGGHVLLTNLRQFSWAELDRVTGRLTVLDTVAIADGDDPFARHGLVRPDAGRRLAEMLDRACALRASITDADHVARLLAYHAGRMLAAVEAAGDPKLLLRPLAESMREGLGMDLDDAFFAPTIVQTLIYAVFASWIDTDDVLGWNWTGTGYHLRIRVVAELFHQITDPEFVRRCNLAGHLDAAARVLKWVDREQFGTAFDRAAIEYFYEPFLARFDPDLRDRLGVWYTPREIAEYQVRRADHHLRHDLGITAGLADDHVVILDPAVGTGTYLRAVLDAIYKYHVDNGEPPTLAAERIRRAALTRIIGFEILPAAFVIAHLHLNRHLARLNAPVGYDHRLRIYLTNSLLSWGPDDTPPPVPLPGVEEELRESLAVKHEEPVLVVLGNPPYQGYSAADNAQERALLDDWIEPLWREYGLRKHRLGDLYVRFWRIAVRKIAGLTGRGVVTYITNRKWLGGRSFPAMRDGILHAFHTVVIDDLHGDVHDTAHPGDGSVFTTETAAGIQRGVAIATLVRTGPTEPGRVATVLARELRGSGPDKRTELTTYAGDRIDAGLDQRPVSRRTHWKLTASTAGDDPALDEYVNFYLSGVQPVREEAVTDTDRHRLADRMRDYFNPEFTTDELIARHPAFGVTRARYHPHRTRERLLRDAEFEETRIRPFLFRPFDVRWVYWETRHKLLNESRRELMPYYVNLDTGTPVHGQYAIVASQTPRRPGAARPALTSAVPGMDAVDPNARVIPRIAAPTRPRAENGATPLPLEDGGTAGDSRTNVAGGWLAAARAAGIDGDDLHVGDTIFYALIAVMYAPTWVNAVGTDHDDFAPVPLPGDPGSLRAAAELGRRIAALADPRTEVPGVTDGRLDPRYAPLAVPGTTGPARLTAGTRNAGGRWAAEAVLWDDGHGWHNVSQRAWQFSVGGFPVLPKWLGYRHQARGVALSAGDIVNFTHLVRRVTAICDLGDECEAVYRAALDHALESTDGDARRA